MSRMRLLPVSLLLLGACRGTLVLDEDEVVEDCAPVATDPCNGLDDDCDGIVDGEAEGTPPAWYADADGDGFGADELLACEAPQGYVTTPGDCDDGDPAVHPGAVETCDGIDEDCDGAVDEDAADAATWYQDADGDGYGDAEASTAACEAPDGFVDVSGDCDDAAPNTFPGVPEDHADGVNQDCDAWTDEYHVCPGALANDFDTITEAVSSVPDAAVVEVCPGTYYESVELPAQSITVVGSTGDPRDVVIDGSGLGRPMWGDTGYSGDGPDLVWSISALGFTGTSGGPYLVSGEGLIQLTDFAVFDTVANTTLLVLGHFELARGLVEGNLPSDGQPVARILHLTGPLTDGSRSADVSQVWVDGNGSGDLPFTQLASVYNVALKNVIMTENHAGSGIYASNGAPSSLTNCTLIGNSIASGAGLIYFLFKGPTFTDADLAVRNGVFARNSGVPIRGESNGSYDSENSPWPVIEYNMVDDANAAGSFFSSHTNFVSGAEGATRGTTRPYFAADGTDRGDPSPQYDDADGTRNDVGAYGGPLGNWFPGGEK